MCVVNVNNMEAKEAYANWLLDTKKIVNRTKVSFFMDMANFSSKSLLHFVNRMLSACVIVRFLDITPVPFTGLYC